MLIWIKVPYVAVGVLAAFVLLLSTVVSEDVSSNTTADDFDLVTTDLTLKDELQLMQLPFADKLSNTCDLQHDRTTSTISFGGHRAHFELEFLRFILVYVNFTKSAAAEILYNHTIKNCPTHLINNLPHTPKMDELKGMDIKEALNKIYSSLLVHTGYTYFIYHQYVSSDIRCSEDDREQRLAELSRDLAEKQRFLACRMHVGMKILGYYEEDISSVLNENISNSSQCSSRALRNCQVMKSINNFLDIFREFIVDYAGDSSTSMPYVLQRTTR